MGHFARMLTASRKPLKIFLLDQSMIAGIGNIYSSEAMWRARIDPRRAAHLLSRVEVRRLHKAIVDVLQRALECCLAKSKTRSWRSAKRKNESSTEQTSNCRASTQR